MLAYVAAIAFIRVKEGTFAVSFDAESGLTGLVLAIAVASAAVGFWAGRWRALLLVPVAPAMLAIGGGGAAEISRAELALLLWAPTALLALVAGIGARVAIRFADGRRRTVQLPPGRAGVAVVLAAAAASVAWFAVAWFVLRASLDSYTTCGHEPCFGAPATGARSPADYVFGGLQAAVACVGIAALATLAVRGILVAARGRLGGPLRVAGIALAVWVFASVVVDGGRPSPAEARRTEGVGVADDSPTDLVAQLDSCRTAAPFPVFDLGEEYAGMPLAFVRCRVHTGFAVYELGYRREHRSIWISESTPQAIDMDQFGCPPATSARGVPSSSSAYELRLYPRDTSINLNLTAAGGLEPLAVANALRAPGFPAGAALPPRKKRC